MKGNILMSDDKVQVLLIEDDPRVRQLYELVLTMEEYSVISAVNGEEGLQKAEEFLPDLIFLDLRIPKISGLDLLQILRSNPKTTDIPVVILSNFDDEATISKGLELGAREYIIKSRITPKDLPSKVEEYTHAE
jgi:DNA-binding response OmpR family regulator